MHEILFLQPGRDELELKIEDLWMSLRSVFYKIERIP